MIAPLKDSMQKFWRSRRMEAFLSRMQPQKGAEILDIGGTPELWEMIDLELDVTLLNLSQVCHQFSGSTKRVYSVIEADATDTIAFRDRTFDIVFSNSVIEHLGDEFKQTAFVQNVYRLAPQYWIQTPSIWFPIEAHCNLPLWWFYPQELKQVWLNRWQDRGRKFLWKQMQETQVFTLAKFKTLLPDSAVYVERFAGFPKSYSLYHRSNEDVSTQKF